MFSFVQLIIIYSIIFTTLLIAAHKIEKYIPRFREEVKIGRRFEYLLFTLFVTLVLVQIVDYLMISSAQPNPDTYGYLRGVEYVVYNQGLPREGFYDPFYQSFPVFVLIGGIIAVITGMNNLLSLILSHLSFILLFLLAIILPLARDHSRIKYSIAMLLLLSNPYIYGYMKLMIPQVGGAVVLLLLLSTLLVLCSQRLKMTFLLLFISGLGLIHFGVLPLFSLIVGLVLIIENVVFRKSNSDRSKFTFVLALLIHMTYTFYAYSFSDLTYYIKYYFKMLYNVLFAPKEAVLITISGEGLAREYKVINALGPAAFAAVTLYNMFTIFVGLFRHRNRSNSLEIVLYMVGIVMVGFGILRYYFATDIPSASIARYINVYGFFLLILANILTFSRYKFSKILFSLLFLMLIGGVIGAMLDPLSFPTKPKENSVISIKIFSSLIADPAQHKCLVPYYWYYIGPLTTYVLQGRLSCFQFSYAEVLPTSYNLVYSSPPIETLRGGDYIIINANKSALLP